MAMDGSKSVFQATYQYRVLEKSAVDHISESVLSRQAVQISQLVVSQQPTADASSS